MNEEIARSETALVLGSKPYLRIFRPTKVGCHSTYFYDNTNHEEREERTDYDVMILNEVRTELKPLLFLAKFSSLYVFLLCCCKMDVFALPVSIGLLGWGCMLAFCDR